MIRMPHIESVLGGIAFVLGCMGGAILWLYPVSTSQFRVVENTTGRTIYSAQTSTSLTAFVGQGAAVAFIATLVVLSLWVWLAALRSSVVMAWLAVGALLVYSVGTAYVFADAPLLIALLAAASATIITVRQWRSRPARQR